VSLGGVNADMPLLNALGTIVMSSSGDRRRRRCRRRRCSPRPGRPDDQERGRDEASIIFM
jgi:hypothetical protein